jgi:NADH:ubiquinone reductase (H+-translocating)
MVAEAKDLHRVVIVGGGFGGLYAARSLRRASVQVTLVDRRNFHLFQPLLYQVATGALSPANIAAPLRSVLKRQKNAQVLLTEATGFDLAGRRVLVSDGSIPYDSLIVAAGAENFYFGHDAWESLAPGLKTIEDATRIRGRILTAFEMAERQSDPQEARHWLTFVVIGGGPTGVELAGALAEIAHGAMRREFRAINPADSRIILIESHPRVLPPFPPGLSEKAKTQLEQLGVVVRSGAMVAEIAPCAVTVRSGDQTEVIRARTVVWGAGVKASPLAGVLAQATGQAADRGGRIEVQPDLTLSGHPEVFVIGDLAAVKLPDGRLLPGVAPVAMQEGRYAARLIARRLRGKTLPPFRYRDFGMMATIGRARAVAELGQLKFSGYVAWLVWLFVHLMYIVEFENRLLVLFQWAWNYLTWNRSARLITEETPVPPRC